MAGLAFPLAAAATTFMVHTGPGTTFDLQVTNLQVGDSSTFLNGTTGGFLDVRANDKSRRCAKGRGAGARAAARAPRE